MASATLGYRNHPKAREITNAGPRMLERARKAWLGPGRLAECQATGESLGHEGLATGAATIAPAEQASAAPAGPSHQEMMESVADPEFQLATEVLYHGARQAFLAGMHRWMMFAAIMFGASVAVPFLGGEKLCGLLAAAAAAADIAFDFVGSAQAHGDIRRRYLDLVARLAADNTDEAFAGEWMKISADEPPLYRNAKLIAFRDACASLGRDEPDKLSRMARITAHLLKG